LKKLLIHLGSLNLLGKVLYLHLLMEIEFQKNSLFQMRMQLLMDSLMNSNLLKHLERMILKLLVFVCYLLSLWMKKLEIVKRKHLL